MNFVLQIRKKRLAIQTINLLLTKEIRLSMLHMTKLYFCLTGVSHKHIFFKMPSEVQPYHLKTKSEQTLSPLKNE